MVNSNEVCPSGWKIKSVLWLDLYLDVCVSLHSGTELPEKTMKRNNRKKRKSNEFYWLVMLSFYKTKFIKISPIKGKIYDTEILDKKTGLERIGSQKSF